MGVGVTRGHLGLFGVNIQSFSNLGKLYTKMKLRLPWLRIIDFRGHPRSPDPKLGGFVVIWGRILKIFKPGQIIYENEAQAPVITQKCFSRSPEVTRPQIGGICCHLGSKYENFWTHSNYIPKWSFWSTGDEKVVLEVTWGHLIPNLGHLRSQSSNVGVQKIKREL